MHKAIFLFITLWDGGAQVTGTVPGPIAGGATADYTFAGTVDLSTPGQEYVFMGCTNLSGDTNPGNDCKTVTITNVIPTYCDASTTTQDEWIAQVICGDIDNSSGWQGGVANYTDIMTTIDAGMSEAITVENGNAWASDIVYAWVDWNDNFDFESSEEFQLTNVGGFGQTFEGTITAPPDALNGEHRMRVRMTYSTPPTPCGSATYGEVEDYTIISGGGGPGGWLTVNPIGGSLGANQSQNHTLMVDATGLEGGTYGAYLNIASNDPNLPTYEVPVTLTVLGVQLDPPTDLEAEVISDDVYLSWTPPEPILMELDFDAVRVPNTLLDETRGLLGYNVYRNNVMINQVVVSGTTYLDDNLLPNTYNYYVTALYDEGESLPTNTITVIVEAYPQQYFETIWSSPYNPMTFYILESNIDGIPLQSDNEIGLFDIDPYTGEEICVGAGVLTETLGGGVFLEIIASMDDGFLPDQANGYTPGNPIIYKFWNETSGVLENVSATYPYSGYDEVFTSQGTAFVELNGTLAITQTIDLQTGWNMMSLRVQPENWNMLDIVQPLIDNDVLYKVMNETGGTIFHLPFPPPNGQWSNTIGDMANTEGYYIRVTDNAQLSLEGFVVETPFDIPLVEGWNMISYPCEQPQNALDAVQPLIDQGLLYKVIDEAGGTIFHLPFPPPNGQWSNTIGNFESGEGYYVRVTGDAALTLDEPRYGSSLASQVKTRIETTYFQPVWSKNPYMPM
nr:fibronectin type III domain-containing protein [Bacteroidota bacterium]